jgi:hypothetical protein
LLYSSPPNLIAHSGARQAGIGNTTLCKKSAPESGSYGPVAARYSTAETVNATDDGRMLPLEIAIHPQGLRCEDQPAEAAELSSGHSLKTP